MKSPTAARRTAAAPEIDEAAAQRSINTIRGLAMDAVEQAQSGHPGTPMALAPAAYLLWTEFLRHSPGNPLWPDRDRFVLSCGHASMLLYSVLYLAGYDLPLEEIVRFRQWGSHTPGHPERDPARGVETTTGPLGQGLGNSVGMVMAERFLADRFNRDGYEVVNHRTWVFASDGDIMEGVGSEASSLAGHLRLGKLNVIYDDNRITIDGSTSLTLSEDVGRRYEAYGWHVQHVDDGNDLAALARAMQAAAMETSRPSLIVLQTHIAYPAPNAQDTSAAHGAPLGADEVRLTKEIMGWPTEETFHVPDDVLAHMRECVERGSGIESRWTELFQAYREAHPDLAAEFDAWISGELPDGWDADLPDFSGAGAMATRAASGKTLNALAPRVPNLLGGSADLGSSNKTFIDDGGDFGPGASGRNIHFGVREHAMGACVNGLAEHGGLRPYAATFLIFTDYMRPSIRLAALMELPTIYVCTHDSIGLGEDGPTHQPIEQVMTLRSIPNMMVIRPADATETVEAWRVALERRDGPVLLSLTRQKVPTLDRSELGPADGLRRGAYVLYEPPDAKPEAILIGTGSETHIALQAGMRLSEEGTPTRVVSMPSWELFEAQPEEYRREVLPPTIRARVSVEAGTTFGWDRYVTEDGAAIGIDRFGASAPGSELFEQFGFTVDRAVEAVKRVKAGRTK